MSRILPGAAPVRQATPARRSHSEQKDREDPAFACRALDPDRCHQSLVRGKNPLGRTIRMIRNAIWPARICQVGDSAAPNACAMPSTMPPSSVPHRLPSPPMITASKAKIRRIGPAAGSKVGADRHQHAGERGEDHGDRHGRRHRDGDCRCPSAPRCRHHRRWRGRRGRMRCDRTGAASPAMATTAVAKTISG